MRVVVGLSGGWCWLWGVVCMGGMAHADAMEQPLALSNRSPLVQIHGLPGARSGDVLAQAQVEGRLALDVASHFIDEADNVERLQLDGETRRLELGWRAGLGCGWEVGVALPLIEQTGGNLDGFIEGFHDFWGLPDGGRPQAPRNRRQYVYLDGKSVPLNFQHGGSAIGDAQISAAYQLWRGTETQAALAAMVKLPTGDADRLTGNGATATDLMLAVSTENLWGSGLYAFGNVGVLWLELGEVLPSRQRDSVWHGGAGLGWRATRWLELKMQLDTHRALYDSGLRALGDDAAQLIVGGSARLGPHWLLDLGVGEDVRVDTAPDVTLQLALRWLP